MQTNKIETLDMFFLFGFTTCGSCHSVSKHYPRVMNNMYMRMTCGNGLVSNGSSGMFPACIQWICLYNHLVVGSIYHLL